MQSVDLVSIFVASPSDVLAERESVEKVVRELNITLGPMRNARFDLVRWETHSYPAAAADPQDAINQQLGTEHDIVVGIFWGRIGSPTPRATSGTIEEVERALLRKAADPNSVEIMIYFKTDGLSPLNIDIDQIARLKELRSSLGPRGILFRDVTAMDFEGQVRVDLTKAIYDRLSIGAAKSQKPSPRHPQGMLLLGQSTNSQRVLDLDDAGFDELAQEASVKFEQSAAAMARITQIALDTGEQFDSIYADLASGDVQIQRNAVERLAGILQKYAADLGHDTAAMALLQEEGLAALARSIVMASQDKALSDQGASTLLESLSQTKTTFQNLANSVSFVRTTLSGIPRRTKALNHARREAVEASDTLIAKLASWIRIIESIETTLVEEIEASRKAN